MNHARDDQPEEPLMAEPRADALAKALSRGGSRRYLVGGLLAGALGVGLGPAAEQAEAARSVKQCLEIKQRQELRSCLRRAARRTARRAMRRPKRRNNRPGKGLLRNFALTVVNNSSKEWLFVIGSHSTSFEHVPMPSKTTRRVLVEDDIAIFFFPTEKEGSGINERWDGRVLGFNNPLIGEVHAHLYGAISYSPIGRFMKIHASVGDSRIEWQVGESHTVDFLGVPCVVKRNPNDKNKGDYYIEFEMTFN